MFLHLSSMMKNLFFYLLAFGSCLAFAQAPSMVMPEVDSANFIAIEGCYYDYESDTLFQIIEFSLLDQDSSLVLDRVLCDSLEKTFLPVGQYVLVVHDYPSGYMLSPDSLSAHESWDDYYEPGEGNHHSPIYVNMTFPVQVVDSFNTTIKLPTREYSRTNTRPYHDSYYRSDNSASGGSFAMKYARTENSGTTHWTQFGWTAYMMAFNDAQNVAFAFEQGMELNYGWNDTPLSGFDRSRYFNVNYNLGPFVRFVINQKQLSHGAFLDVGSRYYVPFVYRRTDATWSANYVQKWLHRWDDLRVFSRVGFDWFSLTAEYAVLNSIETGPHPLPRLSFGVSFQIDGNPWGAEE